MIATMAGLGSFAKIESFKANSAGVIVMINEGAMTSALENNTALLGNGTSSIADSVTSAQNETGPARP
jgi:hypothetical protein